MQLHEIAPKALIALGIIIGMIALVRVRTVQKQEPRQFGGIVGYCMTFIEILCDHVGHEYFGSPVKNEPLRNYARATCAAIVLATILFGAGILWQYLIMPTTWA